MEIVIDIPEDYYKAIKEISDEKSTADMLLIKNGTPLPKGHGDLIDKDKLLDKLDKAVKSVDDTNRYLLRWDRAVASVHLSKPIIEADRVESEGTV